MGTFLLMLPFVMLAPAEDAITEVSLERMPCYGTCPVDRVVLRADGTAEYTGKMHVKRTGTYRGTVDKDDFEKLAKLVAEAKFFDLKDRYSRPITDHPTLITTVRRGQASKTVSDYARAAPEGLQEVEKQIVAVMDRIRWTKAE